MELVMMKLKDSLLSRAAIQFWNLVELLLLFIHWIQEPL